MNAKMTDVPLEQRMLARVQLGAPDECWLWTGYVDKGGRGSYRYEDINVMADRFFYEEEHGPIPKGLGILNDCSTRSCVNPKHQTLVKPGPRPTAPEGRFWAKVSKGDPGECWLWTGHLNNKGYGTLYIDANNRHSYAHRFAYRLLVGDLPDSVEVDHICHTPACVNPDHLRLATHRLNSQNRSGPPSNNKSGHLGVYFNTRDRQWVAQVKHRGQFVFIKQFRTKEDAAAAAADARNQYFTYNILDRL